MPLRASKMKGLHLGIPALGAVTEMNSGVQKFLDIDSIHDACFSFMTGGLVSEIVAASVSTE